MSEEIPQDWRKSKITPIYKQKGDPLDCVNFIFLYIHEAHAF